MSVKVLVDHFLGLTVYCTKCGALLGYTAQDIYEKQYIYCPRCKEKIVVPLQL